MGGRRWWGGGAGRPVDGPELHRPGRPAAGGDRHPPRGPRLAQVAMTRRQAARACATVARSLVGGVRGQGPGAGSLVALTRGDNERVRWWAADRHQAAVSAE